MIYTILLFAIAAILLACSAADSADHHKKLKDKRR